MKLQVNSLHRVRSYKYWNSPLVTNVARTWPSKSLGTDGQYAILSLAGSQNLCQTMTSQYLVCTPPWLLSVPSNLLCENVTSWPALFDMALCMRCTRFCRELRRTPLCNLFIHWSWGSTVIKIKSYIDHAFLCKRN